MKTICLLLACLPCFFAPFFLRGNDVLLRRIEVSFYQTPIKDAMAQIAQKGGFEWSYNAAILDSRQTVTLVAKNQTIGETLHEMFGSAYTFKQSGNYLILKKVKRPDEKLIGYVRDPRTGQKMSNVTVYDRTTLRSTTTDANGYYELPVKPNSQIVIAKLAYRDTLLQVSSQTPRFVKIDIHIDSVPAKAESYTFLESEINKAAGSLERIWTSSSQFLTGLNVKDSLQRRFQFSLLPTIGTNHVLSGKVINEVSINAVVGYSRGVRGFEIAGLGNITRGKVVGFQGAGLFNEVRENVEGVQLSGFYNRCGGAVRGLQAAGFINLAHAARGASVQLAGGFNLTPSGHFSVQAAGIANQCDTATILQAAGLYNWAKSELSGVQAAGLFNAAWHGKAYAQLAGLGNWMRHGKVRHQAAGLFNLADTLRGMQLAGVFNRAHKLRGLQMGLINSAGEIDGMQIGLLNFSRKGGYVVLETASNEVQWANLAFKSGTPRLYTIFTAGCTPAHDTRPLVWSYGAGFGAFRRFNSRIGISLDLIHRQIEVEGQNNLKFHAWEQILPALEIRVWGAWHLALGVSANLYIAEPKRADGFDFKPLVVPSNFPKIPIHNAPQLSAWAGAYAGIRYQFSR
ncbi:MAG: STN domain-containing protein [Bacteroidetes bacterium]|nr:STN domain-containing protein [Bacteroidota bacterium]